MNHEYPKGDTATVARKKFDPGGVDSAFWDKTVDYSCTTMWMSVGITRGNLSSQISAQLSAHFTPNLFSVKDDSASLLCSVLLRS